MFLKRDEWVGHVRLSVRAQPIFHVLRFLRQFVWKALEWLSVNWPALVFISNYFASNAVLIKAES